MCSSLHLHPRVFSDFTVGRVQEGWGSSSVCDGISGPETELELDGAGLEV